MSRDTPAPLDPYSLGKVNMALVRMCGLHCGIYTPLLYSAGLRALWYTVRQCRAFSDGVRAGVSAALSLHNMERERDCPLPYRL